MWSEITPAGEPEKPLERAPDTEEGSTTAPTEAKGPSGQSGRLGIKAFLRRWFLKVDGTWQDRPHPLDLGARIAAPVVTSVAIIMTVVSLDVARRSVEISETNMKVGQRAYLVARNGRAVLTDTVGPMAKRFEVLYEFELHNVGRTPAELISYRVDFLDRSSGVFGSKEPSLPPVGNGTEVSEFGQVAQDSFTKVFNILDYQLPAHVKAYSGPFRLRTLVNYKDVFGDRHTVKWCWYVDGEGSKDISGSSRDCS